jgi:hypothetical protein
MTLFEARKQYFIASHLPADGGYDLKWVPLKLGGIQLYIYNSHARRRAVPYHDLHHVLTGYDASAVGEGEIGAWELAAGTDPHWFATLINLPAVLIGLCLSPRRVFDAFIRGRRSRSLYREPITEALLSSEVAEVQARLGLIGKNERALFSDYLTFAELCIIAVSLVLVPVLCIVWLVN